MNKKILLIFIPLIVFIITATIAYAIPSPITDNSGRKEYVYCPLDTNTLDPITTYEVNGCPIVRIYVDNWNSLTQLQQNTIDSQLRASGFVEPSEILPLPVLSPLQ